MNQNGYSLKSDHKENKLINLSCGHWSCQCRACKANNINSICRKCGTKIAESYLRAAKESVPARGAKFYLSDLFDDLEKRATDAIATLKS